MSFYSDYLQEIEVRKTDLGLAPKPIDGAELTAEIIAQIKDTGNENREGSLNFFIYNTLPGTTPAAGLKAAFLKDIVIGNESVAEISAEFALEQLSHMKGGPSVEALLDIALSDDAQAAAASEILKSQVFLYDADTKRLADAFNAGNANAKAILESYAQAEFFTKLDDIPETVKVITYIAAEGDISTDLLSPGNQSHSRADRELHGKCMISPEAQQELADMGKANPDAKGMLIA